MKNKLSILLSSFLIFGSSCSFYNNTKQSEKYSYFQLTDDNQNNIDNLINSTYKLRQDSSYIETITDGENRILLKKYHEEKHFGSLFAFGRDSNKTYFATAEHCLAQQPKIKEKEHLDGLVKSNFALEKTTLNIIRYNKNEEEILGELKEIVRSEEYDSAILMCTDLDPKKFPVYSRFIEPKLLKQGQFIYSIGFPHNSVSWGKQLNQGIISSLDTEQLPFDKKKVIFTEATLDHGMSGGPSYILIDRDPYVVGVNSGIFGNLRNKYGVASGLLDLIKKNKMDKFITIYESEKTKVY